MDFTSLWVSNSLLERRFSPGRTRILYVVTETSCISLFATDCYQKAPDDFACLPEMKLKLKEPLENPLSDLNKPTAVDVADMADATLSSISPDAPSPHNETSISPPTSEARPNSTAGTIDWLDPAGLNVDFSPPPSTGTPPPSPRPRQSAVFDNIVHPPRLTRSTKSRLGRNRPATAPPFSTMGHQPQKKSVVSRPTCTHISMVKVYFDRATPLRCYQCGRVPSAGFIYSCEQDRMHSYRQIALLSQGISPHNSISGKKNNSKRLSGKDKCRVSSESPPLDPSILSPAIQTGVHNGFYTDEQIEKLVQQKFNLYTVFAQMLAESDDPKAKSGNNGKTSTQKSAQLDEDNCKNKDRPKSTRKASASKSIAPCEYKVCHTCRPNSREKSFMSFEAVFNGDIPPIGQWCARTMPVMPSHVVRNLGLRAPSETPASSATTDHSHDAQIAGAPFYSPRPTTWSPSTQPRPSTSAEGFRQGLRKSLLDLLRVRLGAPSPASAPPSVESSPRDSGYSSQASTPVAEDRDRSLFAKLPDHTETLNSQIHCLSDLCTNDVGQFDVARWRQLSDEVLAQAVELQLSDEPESMSTAYEQDLAKASAANLADDIGGAFTQYQAEQDVGDLSRPPNEKMNNDQDVLEEKLKALKDSADDEGVEAGLQLSGRFGALGLRLTEEAAETNSPDVIVRST